MHSPCGEVPRWQPWPHWRVRWARRRSCGIVFTIQPPSRATRWSRPACATWASSARATTRTCCTSRGKSAPDKAGRTASSRRSGARARCELDAQPVPLPAPGRLRGPPQRDRRPGAGRTRPAADDPLGCRVLAALDARRSRRASNGSRTSAANGSVATTKAAIARTCPAVRGCRRTCTLARSARGSAWPRRAMPSSISRTPRRPPTVSSAKSAGASSRITCCITSRIRPNVHSTNASNASRGRRIPPCCAPGSRAAPAFRSSMPACVNCGRPASCTTASA